MKLTIHRMRHIKDRHYVEAKVARTLFNCPVEMCNRHNNPFTRRDNMLRHVRKQHKGNNAALAAALTMRGEQAVEEGIVDDDDDEEGEEEEEDEEEEEVEVEEELEGEWGAG